MSRIAKRFYSAMSSSSASEIASKFLIKHTSQPPKTVTQYLDTNQYTLFASTIPHPAYNPLGKPTPSKSPATSPTPSTDKAALPPCYHLAYFTPTQPTCELGLDGTDTSYNPLPPFTRRMWAGGSLHWKRNNALQLSTPITETTHVLSAAAKTTKAGEEMIVVGISKEFANDKGVALTDNRNWIFRKEIVKALPLAEAPSEKKEFPKAMYIRDFTMDAITLFRFSACTFNGHKIHYSREWCREVEGHRGLVVHGPLNLTLMVELWRDVVGSGKGKEGDYGKRSEEIVVPESVIYRATHPLYVDEAYRICLDVEGRVSEVKIVDSYGNVCMKGTITAFE